ncbi:MAG: G/T mismatches repair enzyme [Candidatus Bathyarchaeota archaeon BA1]|nr:MAG: G/T mismatches repair enzyme [Candidatus Bathyarchaeota archaeon BA1]
MAENRAMKILHILLKNFSFPQWVHSAKDPFRTLIVTVISQNTANKNTAKAFESLSSMFPITPEALAKADVGQIEDAIRVAGLYRNKSRVIKELSRMVVERFHGSLDFIYSMHFEEARKTLLTIPGVGPKTADVVLLFCAERPTVPVDTHVNRVSKRLGLAPPSADYDGVRLALQSLYPPEEYLPIHILLIQLGRKYCKAWKPLCKVCVVSALCPSGNVGD